jgi:ComF family protein
MLKNILKYTNKWMIDLSHIVFPNICLICEKELINNRKFICSFCENELNYTFFEKYSEPTVLDELFWGRVKLEETYSYLYFQKGKKEQNLIHALKYSDKKEIGLFFGNKIGASLLNTDKFKDVDALIPVPLHYKKQFKRGYNQSKALADGVSDFLNIIVDDSFLKRSKNSSTQTKNNKASRWDNVQNVFDLNQFKKYKHIAIIDDVITTGSTLEVIISMINKKYPEIRISIISLALTK